MTESQEPQTIKFSSRGNMPRWLYLKRCAEALQSKLEARLKDKDAVLVTPIGDVHNNKSKVIVRCACGGERSARISDLLVCSGLCKSCANSHKMLRAMKTEKGRLHQQKMSCRAAETLRDRYPQAWCKLRRICNGAKSRCVNVNSPTYPNYGGRGIEFRFKTGADMARWVVGNLGYPEIGQSIDRKDNARHYEPGNLRWASDEEQANNKRPYKGWVYGDRIRGLEAQRPDLCYETIRSWVTRGMTDEQIITKRKSSSGRPRLRHPELRTAK